jgi:hypothetical protein
MLAGCGDDETLADELARFSRDTAAAPVAPDIAVADTSPAGRAAATPPPAEPAGAAATERDSAAAPDEPRTVPPPAAAPGEWTASVVARAPGAAPMTELQEVRTARNETFDRVVFEFAGNSLPGYRAEYVDRPIRQCGSGNTTEIAGDGWLELRLSPARAHTEAGGATVRERERGSMGLPNLAELELTCDFEGEVVWVMGTRSPNPFRVLELFNPPRLVVDVRH